jgi:glyoxylase-like metal-dependent hydrolase (beta-lactamase superfamily II)
MEKLWGRVAPVPKDHLRVLNDGETVSLGPITVRAIAMPGHASHHHVYQWDENLFGGDVGGVRLREGPPIPPFVPPELDIEIWLESIEKMRALEARRLHLPHFGLVNGPLPEHFDALAEPVRRWSERFRIGLAPVRPKKK